MTEVEKNLMLDKYLNADEQKMCTLKYNCDNEKCLVKFTPDISEGELVKVIDFYCHILQLALNSFQLLNCCIH